MSREVAKQMQNVKKTVELLQIRQTDGDPENVLTRQYGFIKFDEEEPDKTTRLSQFIRLALKTDPDTVVKFMRDGWRLPMPDLIISITGGAKRSQMTASVRKSFQQGLVAAAATTKAWIITAGTNAGVVREVGEALHKYRYKNLQHDLEVPCIGIGSWGYTAGKEQLDRSISHNTPSITASKGTPTSTKRNRGYYGINAIQMDGVDVFGARTYVVKQREDKRCDLEPNHTHFLLFDDGSNKSDNVLPLRAEIERKSRSAYLTRTTTGEATTAETPIPIVMVLVEGGRHSITTICEALESFTPVVVVKESGRAADLVADLHTFFCSPTFPEASTCKDIKRRRTSFASNTARAAELNSILSKAKAQNDWVDDVADELCRVLNEHKQFVTIFNFDSPKHHGKLEDAILEAVFNAAKYSSGFNDRHRPAAELKLAMAWRNFDYANTTIFTHATISKWREEDLRRCLVDALRRGYEEFLNLLIEYGTSFEKLTVNDLDELYETAPIDKGLPLLHKIKSRVLTRDDYYNDYLKNQWTVDNVKDVVLGENAPRELFFWALFHDRFELAQYLCSKTWNPSVAPLYGARIYRQAKKRTLDSETKSQYDKKAKQFDTYAAEVIDRCFDTDRDFAVDLLKRPAVAFYNINPLKLALKANCRSFLASRCVQRYLDNEWFGNINYKRQNINIRIFFCSVFLPLLPLFCFTLPYLHRHTQTQAIQSDKHARKGSSILSPIQYEYDIDLQLLIAMYVCLQSDAHVSWTEKIIYFYRAPVIRFYYNLIFFAIFLALFSYVLLVDFFPLNVYHGQRSGIQGLPIPISEMFLHICVWAIIIEELRQFILIHSYVDYFDELSNMIDVFAILLYLLGFATRFIVVEDVFTASKIFFGLDLIVWYIRILHLFAAYERLGPKLLMIFNTMKDLLFFVCFILIFLFGFSITSWSLITTGSQVKWTYNNEGDLKNVSVTAEYRGGWSWRLLRDVTNYGVWKVFGQVDPIEGDNVYSTVAFILAILFVAISNVLLLNVLIALFNVTIQNVHNESHQLWRYQRYLIVNEFRKRSSLPPPFNTIYCLSSAAWQFAMRVRERRREMATPVTIDAIEIPEPTPNNQPPFKITDAMQRENAIAEDFWRVILTKRTST